MILYESKGSGRLPIKVRLETLQLLLTAWEKHTLPSAYQDW